MSEEALLTRALIHFGHQRQRDKCIEECAELIVALRHHPGRINDDALASEVADVLIMAHQMRLMLGKDLVDGHSRSKLARLEGRMSA